MEEKTGIIFYSDRQVLVELFLGDDEKTFFPKIMAPRLPTGVTSTVLGDALRKIQPKVRDKLRVDIENPGFIIPPSKGSFLIVGEWENELPDSTLDGNRLMWVDLNEVSALLTEENDVKAIQELKESYYEITDKEEHTLGIATKEEAEKYNLYHRPL